METLNIFLTCVSIVLLIISILWCGYAYNLYKKEKKEFEKYCECTVKTNDIYSHSIIEIIADAKIYFKDLQFRYKQSRKKTNKLFHIITKI